MRKCILQGFYPFCCSPSQEVKPDAKGTLPLQIPYCTRFWWALTILVDLPTIETHLHEVLKSQIVAARPGTNRFTL